MSGRSILCCPWIHLTVGPVIGLVGQSFIRVLIETDTDCVVTTHIFELNSITSDARFIVDGKIICRKDDPAAANLTGLFPGKKYILYIGNINGSDTLEYTATFHTLPDDLQHVRVILTHKGRIDHIAPQEVNLWSVLERNILETDIERSKHERASHPHNPSVHFIVHNGDFLSVESVLRSKALSLLDLIVRFSYHHSYHYDYNL